MQVDYECQKMREDIVSGVFSSIVVVVVVIIPRTLVPPFPFFPAFLRVFGSVRFEFRLEAFVHRELDFVTNSRKFAEGKVFVAFFKFANEFVTFLRMPVGAHVTLRGHSKP